MVKRALIVAIDTYAVPYTMNSNITDANDLRDVLIQRGYTVTMLTNGNATKSIVLAHLNMFRRISADHFCFAFFGHGSRAPYSGENDSTAECLCCYNWQYGGLIWDYEIEPIFRQFPCEYDLIFGSCFSGGIGEYDLGAIWQACQENEYSYTAPLYPSGVWRGIFSIYLCWFLRNRPNSTRQQIYNELYNYVLAATPTQHCQLRGSYNYKKPLGAV